MMQVRGLWLAGAAGLLALTGGYLILSPSGGGQAMVNVIVPTLSAVESRGKERFNTYCVQCHGPDAGGNEGVGPPLVHKIYEPGHHGDPSFYRAALMGVRAHHWPFGDMPPVPDIREQDITDIISYIRALQRANGIF